jgi:hypothetical protein
MEVQDGRGARLRRAVAGRPGFAALATALYAAASVLATWPAVEHVGSHFLANRNTSLAEASPGDHLQTGWNLWLFGHQLAAGRAPWLDPYSFRPELAPRVNFQGLVFGLPYWPLFALFGAVVAWNIFTLLTFVGAGGAMCAWLRSVGLPRGAALVGGLAFALAPYRVAQSTGHLLGPISLFLPLALLALEKRRPLLGAAAIAAIPLSGQVNLALGAVPFFIAYAFVRGRGLRDALPGAGLALIAAALVQRYAIQGSLHEHGRSLAEVSHYSADWIGFVSRHGSGETFVFLGWLTPVVALAGLALLLRQRRYGISALLVAAIVVPVVIALGTHLPTYRLLRHVVPGLKATRVPERLLPLACLALAALLAVALVRARPWVIALALVLVAADSHVRLYHATRADEGNTAYAAVRNAPPGRLLELPVFLPDIHLNSTYLYYDMTAQRQHPSGYSTTAPRPAFRTVRRLRVLTCGTWSRDMARLHIRYVAVHGAFYEEFFPRCRTRAEATLRRHGFRRLTTGGAVTVWGSRLNPG